MSAKIQVDKAEYDDLKGLAQATAILGQGGVITKDMAVLAKKHAGFGK